MNFDLRYIQKLQAVRNAFEIERDSQPSQLRIQQLGPNDDELNELIKMKLRELIQYYASSGTVGSDAMATVCKKELEKEVQRSNPGPRLNTGRLFPLGSGTGDPTQVSMWHPESLRVPGNYPTEHARPLSATAAAYVLPNRNVNANRTCNNCGQMGHVRSACPNPPVPGFRGGKTRNCRNGKKGGKSRKHKTFRGRGGKSRKGGSSNYDSDDGKGDNIDYDYEQRY